MNYCVLILSGLSYQKIHLFQRYLLALKKRKRAPQSHQCQTREDFCSFGDQFHVSLPPDRCFNSILDSKAFKMSTVAGVDKRSAATWGKVESKTLTYKAFQLQQILDKSILQECLALMLKAFISELSRNYFSLDNNFALIYPR